MQYLYDSFKEEPGFFQFATAITSNDIEEIQTFLDAAVNARYYALFMVYQYGISCSLVSGHASLFDRIKHLVVLLLL